MAASWLGCTTVLLAQTVSLSEYPTPATGSSSPAGITRGPDGALWFTETKGNAIGRASITGVITAYPLPTASSAPSGIALGPDGNLWFTETSGNKIGRITPAGIISEYPVPTAGSGPNGIVWASDVGAVVYRGQQDRADHHCRGYHRILFICWFQSRNRGYHCGT